LIITVVIVSGDDGVVAAIIEIATDA